MSSPDDDSQEPFQRPERWFSRALPPQPHGQVKLAFRQLGEWTRPGSYVNAVVTHLVVMLVLAVPTMLYPVLLMNPIAIVFSAPRLLSGMVSRSVIAACMIMVLVIILGILLPWLLEPFFKAETPTSPSGEFEESTDQEALPLRHTRSLEAIRKTQWFLEGSEKWNLAQQATACLLYSANNIVLLLFLPIEGTIAFVISNCLIMRTYLGEYRLTQSVSMAAYATSIVVRIYSLVAPVVIPSWLIIQATLMR